MKTFKVFISQILFSPCDLDMQETETKVDHIMVMPANVGKIKPVV